MKNERMTQNLMWANICSERISRALRQYKVMQNAYKAQMVEQRRLFAKSSETKMVMPKSWTDLDTIFKDELYFFVVAARQAIRAVWVLEQRGETMPEVRQYEKIKSWREVGEHWEKGALGKTDEAIKEWLTHSDDTEPGLSMGGRGHTLHDVSGVKLRKLKKDLKAARKVAGAISDREWRYCYITPAEAAEILGITVEDLDEMPNKPRHMDFGDVGPKPHGIRYWRDWVEARRDGMLVPPGWAEYIDLE